MQNITLIYIHTHPHHRHLGSQLAELERVIGRMMETDFIEFATTNLSKPLEDYDEDDHVMDEVHICLV